MSHCSGKWHVSVCWVRFCGVSVACNECLCSSAKLLCESQTSSARLGKVRIVVALCDVGL